ncbi:MAG: hypothetical protein V1944_02005 [Candidatus Aenigmatarchaeota archaeon]
MLKGNSKYETLENWLILLITFGAVLFGAGIGLSAINTKGIPAITAMIGIFVSFIFTVALVFVWVAKDIFGH